MKKIFANVITLKLRTIKRQQQLLCLLSRYVFSSTRIPNRNSSDISIIGHSYLRARSYALDISTNSSYGAHKRTMHSLPFIPVRMPGRYSVRALLLERRAECSCTRYAGISALAQLVSLLGRSGSYLDSSPDKQACSLTVRAFRQASTTRSARVFAYLSATPHKVWGFGFGWLSPSPSYTTLCATRQLLSAAAIRHRRLLHGITVKRAPLRAFPP